MEREKIVENVAKQPEWSHLLVYGLDDQNCVDFLIEIESKGGVFEVNNRLFGVSSHTG